MVNSLEHIIKVAVYTRVSSAEQAEKGTSLESQSEQLEKHSARLKNGKYSTNIRTRGFSGKDDKRPALQSFGGMLRLVTLKSYRVEVDRLARNQRLILEFEAELREQDISLFSMKEMVDTSTPIGRTVFQVLGLTAEWERESSLNDQNRTASTIKRRALGWWPSTLWI
jgi:site-specific DNA recombinase